MYVYTNEHLLQFKSNRSTPLTKTVIDKLKALSLFISHRTRRGKRGGKKIHSYKQCGPVTTTICNNKNDKEGGKENDINRSVEVGSRVERNNGKKRRMGLASPSVTNLATETATDETKDKGQSKTFCSKTKFIGSKKSMKMATWNVRTLTDTGKLETAIHEMKRLDVDILGLCEARWKEQGKIICENHTMVYSGNKTKHINGVGLILNQAASSALLSWEAISERIIRARFQGAHSKISVIQIYAPTNTSEDSSKQEFYDLLQLTFDQIPNHDLVILMGDFNAKISKMRNGFKTTLGPFGHSRETNDNGERMLEFCLLNKVKIMNTFFKHKHIHKVTWTSPDGNTKNEIDYICVSKRWSSSIQDIRVKRSADINSDHELVMGKIKIKLKKIKKTPKSQLYDIEKLSSKTTKKAFNDEINKTLNRPEINKEKNDNIDKKWKTLKETIITATDNVVGKKRGKRSERWLSEETWTLIDKRKHFKQKMLCKDNPETRAKYKQIDKQVKTSARRDKQEWVDKNITKAQTAANKNDTRTVYKIIKELTNENAKTAVPIKSKEGNVLNSDDEIEKRWIEHFKTVLNQPKPLSKLEIKYTRDTITEIYTGPITSQETRGAIGQLKNNKAPAIDKIHPEMLKYGGERLVEEMTDLCNAIWVCEQIPEEWKIGTIIPLPKKGDLSNCSNWRGVTLLSIPSKVLCIIILNRIKYAVDNLLRDEQSGFRKGRSCTDAIFALRSIIEKSNEYQIPLYLHFIDFQKAFDSVDREAMWNILCSYGIPDKIVRMIKAVYEGSKCNVKINNNSVTEAFDIKTGVRQGCILSPFLFSVIIDYTLTMQDKKEYGIRIENRTIYDLDFADDIAIICTSNSQLQQCTNEVKENAGRVGLRFNNKKCEVMCTPGSNIDIRLDDEKITQTQTFTYLGSKINSNGSSGDDIKIRIGKASAAFSKLTVLIRSKHLNLKTKLNVYNSIVLPILLYSSETWQLYADDRKRLNAFHRKCLRRILNVTWKDRIRNDEIMRITGAMELSSIIQQRRLRWFGHVVRMKNDRFPKQVMKWKPTGKRRKGRPKLTWSQMVEKELKEKGLSWKEAEEEAHERRAWRFICGGPMCP